MTAKKNQSQVGHYLVSGNEEFNTELKTPTITKRVKAFAGSFSGFGFLLIIIGLVLFMRAEEEYKRPLRIIGWGMFFAGLGPIVPLHLLFFKSGADIKRKAVYGVMTASLYGLLANALLLR